MASVSMETNPVTILTNGSCAKSRAIAEQVKGLGVEPQIVDISGDPETAADFATLFGDGRPHSPSLVIGQRAWRNPAVSDIEKLLGRSGLIPRRAIHYPHQQRVVWHMEPSDAFASYSLREDGTFVFGHIETPSALRGSGLGARLAAELFAWIAESGIKALLTCSVLRRVAASKPDWAARYLYERINRPGD